MARALYFLIVLFIATTGYLLHTVHERQDVLGTVVHHNDAWAMTQTVQELLRVEGAIATYLLAEEPGSRSEIRLRLDIAISRLDALEQGTLRVFLDGLPDRQQALSDLATVIGDLDATLETMTAEQLARSFMDLSDLIGPLTNLSSQAIQHSWRSVEENLADLGRLQRIVAVVVGSLILFWCGLLFFLLRQNRLLDLSQKQGEVLNESLKVAGDALRDKNRRLEYTAHHDSLTALPNRTLFLDELEAAIRATEAGRSGISLLLVDLDDFKRINDTMGHDLGDVLLHQLSERLRAAIAPPHVVCRLGGDEFACLLLGKGAEESAAFARELEAIIAAPYRISNRLVRIGCSIGVATTEAASDTSAQLLFKRADLALYRAKASEKDRVCLFECHMQTEYDDRKVLEDDLRVAIGRGAVDVAYQIQVDVRSGVLHGVEALARWTHPTRGSISPAVFIPLAEEIGLIHDLGLLILTQACAEAATWERPAKIAVNISSLQLRASDFVDTIRRVLATTGLDPRRLELELTESVLLDKRENVIGTLDRLRDLGIRIALDDFGTGYSSLAVLRDIPFDTVKLDKTFVRDIATDQGARELVKLVSDFGAQLGKNVVTEGIETAEQHDVLRHLGCDAAQGFLFGRPVPAADLGCVRGRCKTSLESVA